MTSNDMHVCMKGVLELLNITKVYLIIVAQQSEWLEYKVSFIRNIKRKSMVT